jgi:CheY-like chemotaxis protein
MTSHHQLQILVAEDDENDVLLLERAFKEAAIANPVRFVRDGQEAITYLEAVCRSVERGEPRAPGLLLLDLKMPRRTGMDVLRWLHEQPILRCLPVIVFSSSANQSDVERAYLLGANAFVTKPSSVEQRAALARFIKGFWLEFNQPPIVSVEGFDAAQKVHAAQEFATPVL